MFVDQLPLFEIGLLILVFLIPVLVRVLVFKKIPTIKNISIYISVALICTFISLVVKGTRGGLPGAIVYGWPKEFIHIRAGEISYLVNYFCIDILFYSIVIGGIDSIRDLMQQNKVRVK